MFNVSYILTVLFFQFGPCMGLILFQLYVDFQVYILVDLLCKVERGMPKSFYNEAVFGNLPSL